MEDESAEIGKISKRHGVPLTSLKHVRIEAASLYNKYKSKWHDGKTKSGSDQARALATLLGLVRTTIVEDELEKRLERLERLERERNASSSSSGANSEVGGGVGGNGSGVIRPN